jgi:hypothetical protein
VTLRYQWYRRSASGKTGTISGATERTYTVKASDVGYRLQVKVTGSPMGLPSVAKTSTWTSAAKQAQYQWYRLSSTGKRTAIKKATSSTYKPTTAMKGRRLQVRVTADRSGYVTTTRFSARTAKVLRGMVSVAPKVSVRSPQVDQVLRPIGTSGTGPEPRSLAPRPRLSP